MSNPVEETLQDWQNDASTGDSNEPQPTRTGGTTSPWSLSGMLRIIKSIMRQFTLDPGWISFAGIDVMPYSGGNAPPNAHVPPAYDATSGGKKFSLGGDWLAIATVGRMVRVTVRGAQTIATITDAQYAGGATVVTLDITSLTADLTAVQFSAVGSLVQASGVPITVSQNGPAGEFVVIPASGGTGRTNLHVSGGDVQGDLAAPPSDPTTSIDLTVVGIQGQAWSDTEPASGTAYTGVTVPAWTRTGPSSHYLYQWTSKELTALLGLGAHATSSQGYINFAVGPTDSPILMQWAIGVTGATLGPVTVNGAALVASTPATVDVTFQTPFPTDCQFVIATVNSPYIAVWWDGTKTTVDGQVTAVTLNFENIGAASVNSIGFRVVAIGY